MQLVDVVDPSFRYTFRAVAAAFQTLYRANSYQSYEYHYNNAQLPNLISVCKYKHLDG